MEGKTQVSHHHFEQQFLAHVKTWTTAGKECLLHFDPKGFKPIVKNHNKRPDHISKSVHPSKGLKG